MKILVVTNMYPFPDMDYFGNFLKNEVKYLSEKEKIDVFFVNGRKNKLNYIMGLLKFLTRYKQYDIIHYHHSYVAWYSLFIHRKVQFFTIHEGGNIKIDGSTIVPAYGHGRNATLEKIFKLLNLRYLIFKKMDKIIVTRYSNKDYYFNDKKIVMNPMGIDFNKFKIISKLEARRELGLDQDSIVLFFPHEPRKEKNVELFKQIVSAISNKVNNKVIPLYGGKISADTMYKYINASDICYLTSKFEASPTIVKEALACGVPILCSNVGDLEELLSPIYTDLICENIEEFIEKTLKLLNNPFNRDSAREFLKAQGMEYETTSENIYNLYKEVLK